MDPYQVLHFEFRKHELMRVPSGRLAFIIAATHAANELNVLRNIMVFEARDNWNSEFVKAQTTIRWLTLMRIFLVKSMSSKI